MTQIIQAKNNKAMRISERFNNARILGARTVLILVAAMQLSACANVAVYERDILADPIMRLSDSALADAYDQHLHRARAQGLLGPSTGGGGCGCEQ